MCRMAQALFWISFFSNWAPCRDQVSSPPGWWAVFLVSVLQSGRLYMCSLYSVPTSKGSEANDEPAWTWTPNPHSCGLYSFSSHSPLRYESPLFLIPENFLFLALVWISYFFFLVTFYPSFLHIWSGVDLVYMRSVFHNDCHILARAEAHFHSVSQQMSLSQLGSRAIGLSKETPSTWDPALTELNNQRETGLNEVI